MVCLIGLCISWTTTQLFEFTVFSLIWCHIDWGRTASKSMFPRVGSCCGSGPYVPTYVFYFVKLLLIVLNWILFNLGFQGIKLHPADTVIYCTFTHLGATRDHHWARGNAFAQGHSSWCFSFTFTDKMLSYNRQASQSGTGFFNLLSHATRVCVCGGVIQRIFFWVGGYYKPLWFGSRKKEGK